MFEITPDDIKALNDEDLRTLVALLCEAHVRVRGHPTTSVTYGGDQTAKDGGLDVRVTLPESANMDGFVSRPNTGFQVKKPNMARAGILKEMRPSGKLRAVIKSLISAKGAYIIASSGTSASDSSLQDRLDAMPEALKGAPNAKDLHTDFYDRTRLATEVRNHGGMVLWARQKIGKSVPGWQPFGAWANPAEGADSEYIKTARLREFLRSR